MLIISTETTTITNINQPQASQTTESAESAQHKPRWWRWWRRHPQQPAPTPAPADPVEVVAETPPALQPATPSTATPSTLFGTVAVSHDIGRALEKMEYREPTPIQEQCIVPLLEGYDVVGQAQTGTGKTAAFGIPLVQQVDPNRASVQALVLVPTRELAMQVRDELARLSQFRRVGVVACYGGQAVSKQVAALQRRSQIVVGTPGRLLDHLGRGTLRLNGVGTVVLDEADEMLDIGFLPDIQRILSRAPTDRQTALFSATMPSPIRRIVDRYMRSPMWVRIGEEIETVPSVSQVYYEVGERDRVRALIELLRTEVKDGKVLLFRRTQTGVDGLVRTLQSRDIAAEGVHGGMPQARRNAVMRAFHSGEIKILAATNLAARGLDIPKVSHVVNYDMPQNLEEYVHRIGRTARMGREGTAITFVTEWDFPMLDALMEGLAGELKLGSPL